MIILLLILFLSFVALYSNERYKHNKTIKKYMKLYKEQSDFWIEIMEKENQELLQSELKYQEDIKMENKIIEKIDIKCPQYTIDLLREKENIYDLITESIFLPKKATMKFIENELRELKPLLKNDKEKMLIDLGKIIIKYNIYTKKLIKELRKEK